MRRPSPFTAQQKLNKSTPAANDVGLGDIANDLITLVNEQRLVINTLVAKLNLDAGVTDVNYAGVVGAAVTTLANR